MENPNIEWSHYQVIANQPEEDRAGWVKAVAENGWTVSELTKEIKAKLAPAINIDGDDADYVDPQFKAFLVDYIATQYSFLNKCMYEPFKREIERTTKAARYQHGRTRIKDYEAVREQVDKLCTTPEEIAEEVPITEDEIKTICQLIIDTEPQKYEWRPIGVDTDVRRGALAKGIFRKDSPHYEGRGGYAPNVEWE